MGYDRNPMGTNPGDTYNRDGRDDGGDDGSRRGYASPGARDYQAAGEDDRDGGRSRYGASARGWGQDQGRSDRADRDQFDRDQGGWGRQEHGNAGYAPGFDRGNRPSGQQYGPSRSGGADRQGYAAQARGRDEGGNYGAQPMGGGRGDYGRQPQGYDHDDRGFLQRAGDEVRSWFGDDDAERRRDRDAREDQSRYGDRQAHHRDHDYHAWRSQQVAQFDRDYDEYRRENRTKFHNEFSAWRTGRQSQRDLLGKVTEHMDVVGSDGSHVGTVDKVRGDRIILTKNDADAGGHHHSVPSAWLKTVDTQVTLAKTADEAKAHWRDEERNKAMFGEDRDPGQEAGRDGRNEGRDAQGRLLNRSFSGTY